MNIFCKFESTTINVILDKKTRCRVSDLLIEVLVRYYKREGKKLSELNYNNILNCIKLEYSVGLKRYSLRYSNNYLDDLRDCMSINLNFSMKKLDEKIDIDYIKEEESKYFIY